MRDALEASSVSLNYSPWHRVGVEVLRDVGLAEELHPQDGEDVDDDDEQEGEVPKGAQRADDDAEQHLHRRPGLRQLQYSHLQGKNRQI